MLHQKHYIDSLVQDCSISIANALEILQSCSKPALYSKRCISNPSKHSVWKIMTGILQRHFQMHFPGYFDLSSLKFGTHSPLHNTRGSRWASNRRQAFTWSTGDSIFWRIFVSLGLSKCMPLCVFVLITKQNVGMVQIVSLCVCIL